MLILVLILGGLLLSFEAYTDRLYVCEFTGSRKGDRVWPMGVVTGAWHEASAIERVVDTSALGGAAHHWRIASAAGKNILGMRVVQACGFPDFMVPPYVIDAWVDGQDTQVVLDAYETLRRGDEAASQQIEERIWREAIDDLDAAGS